MNEDILVPLMFFVTVIVLVIGIPLVRSYVRRKEREVTLTPMTPELTARLDRIESIVETVAVEVERLAEGQRFTTRLLSEGVLQVPQQNARTVDAPQSAVRGVTHA
jgi:hypothetical protein